MSARVSGDPSPGDESPVVGDDGSGYFRLEGKFSRRYDRPHSGDVYPLPATADGDGFHDRGTHGPGGPAGLGTCPDEPSRQEGGVTTWQED